MELNNIVVLCDGTWNGLITRTNIHRLALLLNEAKQTYPDAPFVKAYFEGVGVRESLTHFIFNGALATDLDAKVKEAYKFVVKNWQIGKDNRIWLFGFSRGAYTVRALAGLIRNCGIINNDKLARVNLDRALSTPNGPPWQPKGLDLLIEVAIGIYRDRNPNTGPDGIDAKEFRKDNSYHGSEGGVFFLGLFDTVGALGIPAFGPNGFIYGNLHNLDVSSKVKYAYQALATHENTSVFDAAHITRDDKEENRGNVTWERWFPGVHTDIGGWEGVNPIADATLNWLLDKVNDAKLEDYKTPLLGVYLPQVLQHKYEETGWAAHILRFLLKILSLILFSFLFRDRTISGTDASLLYRQGDWRHLARGKDYTSQTYNRFRVEMLMKDPEKPFPPF